MQNKTARKLQNKTPLLGRTLKENPVPVQFSFVCELRTLEGFGDWERNWKRLPVSLQSGIFWDIVKVEFFGTSLTFCQQIFSALAVFPPPNMDQQFGKRAIKRENHVNMGSLLFLIFPSHTGFCFHPKDLWQRCDRKNWPLCAGVVKPDRA